MEPLTGFISIVGLLGQWKSIADSGEAKDFDRYIDCFASVGHCVDLMG